MDKYRKEVTTALAFCKENGRKAAGAAIFLGIFSLLCFLRDVPQDVTGYALGLALFFGGIMVLFEYGRYRKVQFSLEKILDDPKGKLNALPKARTLQERTYQQMLAAYEQTIEQQQQQMEQKYQDMVDYYTMWTHQIKTPIAAMRLLLQEEDMPFSREMQGELFQTEQYVQMALQYLRMEKMTSDLVLEKCNLDPLIRQTVRKYAPVFIRKKIALQYETVSCEVVTDEKWLVVVLEQILSNALKYTKTGKIRICLSEQESKTLVIADTGIGIAAEDLPRIFEKGYTGYNGRMDKRSTGIGLYLCRQIMEKLSHTIRIESEVGKGTQVYLSFPAEESEVRE